MAARYTLIEASAMLLLRATANMTTVCLSAGSMDLAKLIHRISSLLHHRLPAWRRISRG